MEIVCTPEHHVGYAITCLLMLCTGGLIGFMFYTDSLFSIKTKHEEEIQFANQEIDKLRNALDTYQQTIYTTLRNLRSVGNGRHNNSEDSDSSG
jgi:hypothetical protein